MPKIRISTCAISVVLKLTTEVGHDRVRELVDESAPGDADEDRNQRQGEKRERNRRRAEEEDAEDSSPDHGYLLGLTRGRKPYLSKTF